MFRASQRFLRPVTRASWAALPSQSLPGAPSLAQRTIRLASSSNRPPTGQSIDKKHEKKVAEKKLEARPSEVSTSSTVRSLLEPATNSTKEHQDINQGLKHDVNIVKDTFRLDTVPRESHILGLAGTLPYFGTSLSTVFLAWDLTKEVPTGNAFYDAIFVNHDTARYLLDVIEPLQLGYGAVIISFLGAIHWGLEYAERKPQHDRTRFRYGMGLLAPIIAWPTLMMPIEYALTAQFGAFIALYYADSRATTRGWTPPWYAKYRFLLTAMVGLAIFISLIGRAKIEQKGALNEKSLRSRLTEPGIADKHTNWAKLEKEERRRIKEEEAEEAKKEAAEKKSQEGKKDSQKNDTRGKGKGKDDNKDLSNEEKKDDVNNKGTNEGESKDMEEDKKEDKQERKDKDTKAAAKKDEKDESNDNDDEGKDEGKDEDESKGESKDEKKGETKDKDEGEDESKDESRAQADQGSEQSKKGKGDKEKK